MGRAVVEGHSESRPQENSYRTIQEGLRVVLTVPGGQSSHVLVLVLAKVPGGHFTHFERRTETLNPVETRS